MATVLCPCIVLTQCEGFHAARVTLCQDLCARLVAAKKATKRDAACHAAAISDGLLLCHRCSRLVLLARPAQPAWSTAYYFVA